MKQILKYSLLSILFFTSCIGDDFVDDRVDPVLRIISTVESIQFGGQFQFEAMYLNNVGQTETIDMVWSSSDEEKLTIDNNGLASALTSGEVTVYVSVDANGTILNDEMTISIGEETIQNDIVRTGVIEVTSNYVLRGNFSMTQVDDNLVLSIDDTYRASSGLPGLFIYLTNNPSTTAGAYEIGSVNVFDGAHEFKIEDTDIGINDYDYILYFCKPFNVKIGEGKFEE